jgi:hypothetical protein
VVGAVVMCENNAAEFNKLFACEVILAIVRAPRANPKVSRTSTVADVINSWQHRQLSFVLSATLLRFVVPISADQLPSQWLSRVEVVAAALDYRPMNRLHVFNPRGGHVPSLTIAPHVSYSLPTQPPKVDFGRTFFEQEMGKRVFRGSHRLILNQSDGCGIEASIMGSVNLDHARIEETNEHVADE